MLAVEKPRDARTSIALIVSSDWTSQN